MTKTKIPDGKKKLAQDTWNYVTRHMDRHVGLEELCAELGFSGTYIKSCFRMVYGEPIATYVRRYKMREACRQLRRTGRGILEIAGMVGYENGSKFAAAFRSVVGVTPGEYRRMDEASALACLPKMKK